MTYTLSDAAKARRSELDLVRVLPELLTHHMEKAPGSAAFHLLATDGKNVEDDQR